jgi:hypothetical protein
LYSKFDLKFWFKLCVQNPKENRMREEKVAVSSAAGVPVAGRKEPVFEENAYLGSGNDGLTEMLAETFRHPNQAREIVSRFINWQPSR